MTHDAIVLENVELVKEFMKDICNDSKHPGVYLAGGAARTLITNEPVVDYDLFFSSEEVAEQFEDHLLSLDDTGVLYRCPAGELVTIRYKNYKIQLIKKTYHHNVEDLLDRFDFTLCKFGVDLSDLSNVHYSNDDLYDAHNRVLRLNNLQYPVASLHRVQKYLNKGFRPTDWQKFWLGILEASRNIDMTEENMALYID